MDIQNISEEEKKANSGLCSSAGIETPNDEDPTRFQRRHFPNKMTSNIFFCDSSLEDISRKNGDVYASAGVDTRYNDQKQSERRHFHTPSESGSVARDYQCEEQIDSFRTAESKNGVDREEMGKQDADPEQSEKHLHLSTVDGTVTNDFENQDEEGEEVDSAESMKDANRDDNLSEEMDKRDADQQQSEDGAMTSNFTNQDEGEVESSDTVESREVEDEDSEKKKTQRRHFHDKTSSNIFFSGLPIENMSLKNADPSDYRKRKG